VLQDGSNEALPSVIWSEKIIRKKPWVYVCMIFQYTTRKAFIVWSALTYTNI